MALRVMCVLCGTSFILHERTEGLLEKMNAMLAARGEAPMRPAEIACCSEVCYREWSQMKDEERADRVGFAVRAEEEGSAT